MNERISRLAAAVLGATALIAGAVAATSPAHAIPVGGYDFVSSADSLIASNGSFTTVGGTLEGVLTDLDPATYAFSFSPGASVTLGSRPVFRTGPVRISFCLILACLTHLP